MFDAALILAGRDLLAIVVDRAGCLCYVNAGGAERLGLPGDVLSARTLWDLADATTARRLLQRLEAAAPDDTATLERIVLRDAAAHPVALSVVVGVCTGPDAQRLLRMIGVEDAGGSEAVRPLEHSAELLHGFIDASTEAMWCIEYTEPVDLSAAESEIVRQVFENDCHWSMCNRAMARLYNLPDGLDFNRQRVSAYFPRSPDNEAFVRQLAAKQFHVDSAPSMDVRHDGSIAYMENSVRCHVEDGRMLRMWGTVRDTTEVRTAQNRIAQRERDMREVLSALPDAVLVVDKARHALAVNPAFESTFGWGADEVLGKDVSWLVDLDAADAPEHRWFARAESRCSIDVPHRGGERIRCDVRMAPLQGDEPRRFVLALRPEPAARSGEPPAPVPRRKRALRMRRA